MKLASALFLIIPLLSGVSAQQRGQGQNNGGNQGQNNGGNQGQNNGGNQGQNNGGNNGGNQGNGGQGGGDPQTSTTLDPRVIAKGFAQNGQNPPTAGQVASLTSTNNFINFCLTTNLPITDGKQIQSGSCNPAPIGAIPNVDNMPSAKISNPKNGGNVAANTAFTVEVTVRNFETGFFVNAQANYFAAPQQLNGAGQIQGHSHIVLEQLTALDQVAPTDPKKFAFFQGLNNRAVNGKLTATVTDGLPAGAYRACTINSSSNHQPVIAPIAQHGSLDDCSYFTVGGAGGGQQGGNNGGQNGGQQGGNNGAQNGGAQNGGAQNGGAQNGGAQNGGAQNGGAQNGGAQNGGAQNGGAQNGGAQNGGQQGGAQNGGAQNGGQQGGNQGRQNGGQQGNGGFPQRPGQNGGFNRPRRLSAQH